MNGVPAAYTGGGVSPAIACLTAATLLADKHGILLT
jgi:hypothetical protein